jgi:putative flippase GtrA
MENTQTKKQLFFEIFRFLLVGGLATILDYVTAYLLTLALKGYWFNAAISNTAGHVVGLLVNYFLSVLFVYKQVKNKEETKTFKSFMLFVLVDVIGLVATIIVMSLQEAYFPVINFDIFGHEFNIIWLVCKCVMTLVCLIWNYIGRKKFIFK